MILPVRLLLDDINQTDLLLEPEEFLDLLRDGRHAAWA